MPKDPRNILKKLTQGGKQIPAPGGAPSSGSTIHSKVVFSFEFYDRGYECISEWTGDECRELFDAFRQASQLTWLQVQATGGKGSKKVGLGWTDFGASDPFLRPAAMSSDFSIAEMRVTEKARIFGFKNGAVFYVIRLDRNHIVA